MEDLLEILCDTKPVSLKELLELRQEIIDMTEDDYLKLFMDEKFPGKTVEELTPEERTYCAIATGVLLYFSSHF